MNERMNRPFLIMLNTPTLLKIDWLKGERSKISAPVAKVLASKKHLLASPQNLFRTINTTLSRDLPCRRQPSRTRARTHAVDRTNRSKQDHAP
mmetsp:Transcript_15299/g.35029  ORF Transcript_15299/g.35029 Transcript_15299/m.35029 type:complete len:93 (-) Transcript_15299:1170-1448(-)